MKVDDIASPTPGGEADERLKSAMDEPETVVARAGDEAAEVAERIDRAVAARAVVLDERGEPAGVVDPAAVRRAVRERSGSEPGSVKAAVERLEHELPDDRDSLAEAMRGARPGRYWCDAGMHWSNRADCPEHRRT